MCNLYTICVPHSEERRKQIAANNLAAEKSTGLKEAISPRHANW